MSRECLVDRETLLLMLKLFEKGWNVRVWKDNECYAELVAEEDSEYD